MTELYQPIRILVEQDGICNMNDAFTLMVAFVLEREGGYVNNKKDPGGETNYGISKRAYPTIDIKNLRKSDAIAIYYGDYWLPSGADGLTFPLAAVHFDCAVNQGLGRAKNFLKECGEEWGKYIELRRIHYLNLIKKNPKLQIFKNGWLNRLNHLTKFVEEQLLS